MNSLQYCTFEQYYRAHDSFASNIRFAYSHHVNPHVVGRLDLDRSLEVPPEHVFKRVSASNCRSPVENFDDLADKFFV